MLAFNISGAEQYHESDIFGFHQDYFWYPGMFIDQSSPNCRIIIWGCTNHSDSYITSWPLVRYDAYYTRLCQSTASNGDYQRLMGYYARFAGCYSQEFGRIEGPPNYSYHAQNDTNWFRLPSDW